MFKVYIDDIRTPINPQWTVLRSFNELVSFLEEHGLNKIELISFDHDLGDLREIEKTGYDCAKHLVDRWFEEADTLLIPKEDIYFPQTYVHSANPVGSENIIKYINNFLKTINRPQSCKQVNISHT